MIVENGCDFSFILTGVKTKANNFRIKSKGKKKVKMKLQCVMIIIAVLFSGNCLKLVLAGATGIKFNSYLNFFFGN